MQVSKVLVQNYLPYAKYVIMDRAIPSIDGLKPVQRRILYTMFRMKLLNGEKTKSANIVGSTMHIHPHGDSSIYDALTRLTQNNESLNVPYVEGKGNFGKVYSDELHYAASRYTEAKLAQICNEMFDGIDEDAVNMLPSYDNTTVEPELLPVKFPSILVNPSSGIAVAMSSNIPAFGLKQTCDATIAMIKGEVHNSEELMDILGTPDYSTGGVFHATKEQLVKLANTGRQTFTMTGKCQLDRRNNKIIISEIPYNAKAEDIISAVEQGIKDKTMPEFADINDEIDLKGFRVVADLKARANIDDAFKKLCRMTKFHTSISYNTRAIVNNECKALGVYQLLQEWINFRKETIRRIYNFRLNKYKASEYMLEAWEKIKLDIREVAKVVADKNEAGAKEALMNQWKLTDEQADYILDMKIKMFTQDNLRKKLTELDKVREDISNAQNIIDNDSEKYKIMIDDLTRIGTKYGVNRRTAQAEPIPVEVLESKKHVADNEPVKVFLTKKGYLKRVGILGDVAFNMEADDDIIREFTTKNNEYLLVFTYSGEVHKILVDSIDNSRAKPRDTIVALAELQDTSEIFYITVSGNFTGHFNIVYENGRGTRVDLSRISGNRIKYRSLYDECHKGSDFAIADDKFFVITRGKKAAYVDLTVGDIFGPRKAFKAARISSGDHMVALLPVTEVPYPEIIDFDRYSRGYTVQIGYDELWGEKIPGDRIKAHKTVQAIQQMLKTNHYNYVPKALQAYYDPSELNEVEIATLGLEWDEETGRLLLPKQVNKNGVEKARTLLISKDELELGIMPG